MVEEIDEGGVLLAVDGGEFDGDVGDALEGFAGEEVGGGVDAFHVGSFDFGDHGRKLVHVANHQELDTAEGAAALAVAPQGVVDGVEEVGADHGDFIDDEELEGADDVELCFAERLVALGHLVFGDELLDVGEIGVEGELEEGMDGDAAGVDGGDAGGCHDGVAFGTSGGNFAEEGGFACAGFPGEEDRNTGLFNVASREFYLWVSFH